MQLHQHLGADCKKKLRALGNTLTDNAAVLSLSSPYLHKHTDYPFTHTLVNISNSSSPGRRMFLLLLLICVTADGDNTDGGAGRVRNDYRLSLPLPCGAGSPIAPPACDRGAAGRAVMHHGTAGRGVLLHSLRPLWGTDRLGGGYLKAGHVSENQETRHSVCVISMSGCILCFQDTLFQVGSHVGLQ